jgi:hypothetical protein
MGYMQMYDSTSIGCIPSSANAVAGYVDGSWPTFGPLTERFPHAYHLSIAVFAEADADALDVEARNATVEQVPAWVHRQHERKLARPVIYASVSAVPAIFEQMRSHRIERKNVRLWTAHYTGVPHLCGPRCGLQAEADATQWFSNREIDISRCQDSFFGPPPPPPDPRHYLRFQTGPFAWRNTRTGRQEELNEREIVRHFDALQMHAKLNAARIHELRVNELTFLRKRIWRMAHYHRSTPDWTPFFRRWRYEQLLARTRGSTEI